MIDGLAASYISSAVTWQYRYEQWSPDRPKKLRRRARNALFGGACLSLGHSDSHWEIRSKARATALAGNGRESLHLRKLGPEIFAIEQCE